MILNEIYPILFLIFEKSDGLYFVTVDCYNVTVHCYNVTVHGYVVTVDGYAVTVGMGPVKFDLGRK